MNRALATGGAIVGLGVILTIAGWWLRTGDNAAELVAASLPELAKLPPKLRERMDALREQAAADDETALGELARVLHANGFLVEASALYEHVEQREPREPRWPHLHAHLLAGFGRLEEARELWRRAVELAPDYLPARLRLGEVLLKTNQPDAAATMFQAVLDRAPEDAYAWLGLARAEMQLGRLTAARERLQQAVAARPDFGPAWNLLATIYERLGNSSAASAAVARAVGLRRFREMPDPWVDALLQECYDVYRLRVAASAAKISGAPREAVPLLERARGLAPNDPAVHRDLGEVWRELHEFAQARQAHERAVELAPDEEASYVQLATTLSAAGDPVAAARVVKSGVERCPRSAALWFEHGRDLARDGRLVEAIAAWTTVCELEPRNAGAYHAIAEAHFRAGNRAAGVAALESFLAVQPDDGPTVLMLARQAVEVGDAADAMRWITQARARSEAPPGLPAIVQAFERRFGRAP